MRKRHDFEMVDWKVSDGMWYALQYEPRYLEPERDRDLQSWSLFLLAWISALVGMVNDSYTSQLTRSFASRGMEWFIVYSRYPSIIVNRLIRATLDEMEPSHMKLCIVGHCSSKDELLL